MSDCKVHLCENIFECQGNELEEKLRIAMEALEFICTTLVPYAPHSDEGIAIEKAREALAKIQGEK